jgi:hypothetical protein
MPNPIGYTATRGRALLVGATIAASLVILSVAAPALATPTGDFAVFSDCPVTTASSCLYAKTETGEFIVGKKTVPLEKAVVLQGGLRSVGEEGAVEFVAAADGNTLPKVPENVPGGLTGLVNCKEITGSGFFEVIERATCESIFENHYTGVSATTELAAPASSIGLNLGNLFSATGTALSLPVKVHLENPLLGSSCYVGSNSAPIVLELTTGTTSPPAPNKPISGKPGNEELLEGGEIGKIANNSLVNNSFAAPEATGCGGFFSFLIDPIVDSSLGIPAAAGHNTAILNGFQEITSSAAVKAHE